jgi:hypothetical protein
LSARRIKPAGNVIEIVRLRGHLAHARPRVFFLDGLIGYFLERVLVCGFLRSSFSAVLQLIARRFFARTATLAMAPHLSVCWHRQYRDDRSYHKGSHFRPPTTGRG